MMMMIIMMTMMTVGYIVGCKLKFSPCDDDDGDSEGDDDDDEDDDEDVNALSMMMMKANLCRFQCKYSAISWVISLLNDMKCDQLHFL